MPLTKEHVLDLLAEGIPQFSRCLPSQYRSWQRIRVRVRESGYELQESTRPFLHGWPHAEAHRGGIPSVDGFARALADDRRYRAITANYVGSALGKLALVLKPDRVACHLIEEHLWQGSAVRFDSMIAEGIADAFISSLEAGGSEIIWTGVLRGVVTDIEEIPLRDDLSVRQLTVAEVEDVLERNPRLLKDDRLPGSRVVLEERRFVPIAKQPVRRAPSRYVGELSCSGNFWTNLPHPRRCKALRRGTGSTERCGAPIRSGDRLSRSQW